MQFTFYGQSCFRVEINGKHILFDPFISENELAQKIDIHSIEADYILLSHAHSDHTLDALSIALRTGAKVICNFEMHQWFQEKGVSNTHPMNTGGKWDFGDFAVKCTVAQHSSSFGDGTYGGNPMGFIIFTTLHTFYYSGDTALTIDMQLIPRWANLSFAVLPIGDNFTMGIEDAITAARFVHVNKIIGVHYDTFGFIKIDHQKAKEAFRQENKELVLLNIGETIKI